MGARIFYQASEQRAVQTERMHLPIHHPNQNCQGTIAQCSGKFSISLSPHCPSGGIRSCGIDTLPNVAPQLKHLLNGVLYYMREVSD